MKDTLHRRSPRAAGLARILVAALALALLASARADDRRRRADAPPLLPAYAQECGACHLAYPPGLLPAASWQRLMSTLPRHYGSDASLDAAAHEAIARWLQQHAGSSRRLRGDATPPPEDRISRAPWFLRKHRKVPARIWSHPEVRSAARCEACRQGAARGDFDDHAVRLPR